MAPRREVVEGELRRTRPCEATIEHVAKPVCTGRWRATDRHAYGERRASMRGRPRRRDRQARRWHIDMGRSPGRRGRRGRRGRPRCGRGTTSTAAHCDRQRQARAEPSCPECCCHGTPPRRGAKSDGWASPNWAVSTPDSHFTRFLPSRDVTASRNEAPGRKVLQIAGSEGVIRQLRRIVAPARWEPFSARSPYATTPPRRSHAHKVI